MDQKLHNLKSLVKDVTVLAEYFEDPEEIVDIACKLENEAARLALTSKLINRVMEMKNDFVTEAIKLEGQLNIIQKDLDEVVNNREEIRKELNASRMISRGLTHQVLKISEIIQKGNLQPEIIRQLIEKTKTYIARCPTCKREKRGSIEELSKLGTCHICKKEYELFTCYEVTN